MKLLFVSSPGVGHVQPMLGLALAARRHGHAIAWATARDAWPWLHAHDIPTLAAGVPFAQCRAESRARWPLAPHAGRAQAAHAFPHQFGSVVFAHMLAPLGQAMDHWQPDLVVNETAALAAPLAAQQRGLPHITHAFGLPVPAAILHSTTAVVATAWDAAGLEVPPQAGLFVHGGIEITPPALLAAHGHAPHAAHTMHQRASSVTGTPQDRLPAALAALLASDSADPLVYVSFGTLHDPGPAFQHLLNAFAGIKARFVVTAPSHPAPPAPMPGAPNTWMCGYVPQHLLLPHCQAVVSHAGSGSMFGAIAQGLPQLCLPQGADQFRNADALAACGAALMLEGEHGTTPHIRAALQQLLHEPQLRQRARALAQETAAMPTPEHVVLALNRFIVKEKPCAI
jgi:UDP-N-acetylglucosamine:LPS N-acetylglucosamine transferase